MKHKHTEMSKDSTYHEQDKERERGGGMESDKRRGERRVLHVISITTMSHNFSLGAMNKLPAQKVC